MGGRHDNWYELLLEKLVVGVFGYSSHGKRIPIKKINNYVSKTH